MKDLGVILCFLLFLPVPGCGLAGKDGKGPETSLAEVGRIEAPFDTGFQLLASDLDLVFSRNYHQDRSLLLPGGGGKGIHQKMHRAEEGDTWRVQPGPMLVPLKLAFRNFKATVTSRLSVDFPPVREFTIRLRAYGNVLIVLADGRTLRGNELLVEGGRMTLDGTGIPYPAPAAAPPGGEGR